MTSWTKAMWESLEDVHRQADDAVINDDGTEIILTDEYHIISGQTTTIYHTQAQVDAALTAAELNDENWRVK